jgi:hypothetical protein
VVETSTDGGGETTRWSFANGKHERAARRSLTGTGGISDTQSYSWIILNAIFDKLATTSLFSTFACMRINSALPVDPNIKAPFLGVFVGDETFVADGDANATTIGFTHTVVVGFQVVMKHNDPNVLLANLDRASWFTMNQLLRDDEFTNMLHSGMPDNTRIEGFPRGRIRKRWGLTGSKNETPVGERQLDLAYVFRSEWEPTEFPDLERITVTTGFPGPGSTLEVQAAIEQVKIVYQFDPDWVKPPLPPDP